jgi:hypothetical protein
MLKFAGLVLFVVGVKERTARVWNTAGLERQIESSVAL